MDGHFVRLLIEDRGWTNQQWLTLFLRYAPIQPPSVLSWTNWMKNQEQLDILASTEWVFSCRLLARTSDSHRYTFSTHNHNGPQSWICNTANPWKRYSNVNYRWSGRYVFSFSQENWTNYVHTGSFLTTDRKLVHLIANRVTSHGIKTITVVAPFHTPWRCDIAMISIAVWCMEFLPLFLNTAKSYRMQMSMVPLKIVEDRKPWSTKNLSTSRSRGHWYFT